MHAGIGHAFFMIGILLLASRKADIAVAKTILIAYLIGIAAMFAVMNLVMGQSELMNFSIEMIAAIDQNPPHAAHPLRGCHPASSFIASRIRSSER